MAQLIEIPARHGKAFRLRQGQAVRLVNTHGTQVVDCWAWNAYDLGEAMSMEATRVWNQHLNPRVGDTFVTAARRPILTLVEDTSPGVHDTFMAACDRERYVLLGVEGYHRNCMDNMTAAMMDLGLAHPARTLASFNVFMNIAVAPDGVALDTRPTVSRPGDAVTVGRHGLLRRVLGLSSRHRTDPGRRRQHAARGTLRDPRRRLSGSSRPASLAALAARRSPLPHSRPGAWAEARHGLDDGG